MVLTCTGVSFFHGSNDGQKGMGLIMLILIGTVPTAYALNHAVSPAQMQDFIAASEQAGQILDRHIDVRQSLRLGSSRGSDRVYPHPADYSQTRLLALRRWYWKISREVTQYKEFKAVPAQDQSNVRNDMYLASEALRLMSKKQQSWFLRGRIGCAEELQEQA